MSTDRQAKIQAASKGTGTGANAIIVGGIVAIVAVIAVVGAVIWTATRDSGGTADGGAPAGTEMGQPFNPYPDATLVADAPTVDVYEDFRCPACAVFERTLGGTINDLAADGKIKLNVHLKTVIDSNDGKDASAVAGSSALCAADQGGWEKFHEWLFANQPANHAEFSKDALRQAAEHAGLTGDKLSAWETCSDNRTYQAYVTSVDEQTAQDGVTGTPVITVDGTELSWGSFLLDQEGTQADTEAFAQILTSGEVPEDRQQQ